MYSRDELLKLLEERRVSQTEIYNSIPNDMVAYQHLVDVKKHIQLIANAHNLDKEQFLVFENTDYRSLGNDHSEVSKTPIFRCCENCVQSLAWWLREENSGFMKRKEIYYSIGLDDNNRELDKKIVVMAGRSMAESMDSDEMRINGEWLD